MQCWEKRPLEFHGPATGPRARGPANGPNHGPIHGLTGAHGLTELTPRTTGPRAHGPTGARNLCPGPEHVYHIFLTISATKNLCHGHEHV